jgi:hypothetical protein
MRRGWHLPAMALTMLAACHPPVPTTARPEIPQDCPDPPPAMGAVEELRELARAAREARANLMARVHVKGRGAITGPTFATLHPPPLVLLEAVLAAPSKARQMDAAWLRQHLLSAAVELHSPTPLTELDGDLRRVTLQDEKGAPHRALYMTARSDSQGWTYRFVFDPRAVKVDKDLSRVRLTIPLGEATATARWAVSGRTLDEIDNLPILYFLARLREVRWARWDIISGDSRSASEHLRDLLACAPDLDLAERIQRALRHPDKTPIAPTAAIKPLVLKPVSAAEQREFGADPAREIARRAALLTRLVPLAANGLIAGAPILQAQGAVSMAAASLAKGELDAIPIALTDIDVYLATIFADALDVQQPIAAATALEPLKVSEGPQLSDAEIDHDLRERLSLANANLVPRWIRGPGDAQQLVELRPAMVASVDGAQIVSKATRRMGKGWIHAGLPAAKYTTSFADHAADFWREEVEGKTSLDELRVIARRLLRSELLGHEPASVALAAAGVAQLDGAKALVELLPLVTRGAPAQGAAVLRAIATLRQQQVTSAVALAARAKEPELRAAALEAVGVRALPDERGLLRAGLRDGNPMVVQAALSGLLRLADAEGIKTARAWLAGSDAQRATVLSFVQRDGVKLGALKPDLLRLLRAASPSRETIATAVQVLQGGAVAALTQLYGKEPPLRSTIVEHSRGEAFEKLLRRAAAEEDVALQRTALLHLAELRHPPRALFDEAIKSTDRSVRLAAHVGLARLGQAASLLALGEGARGSCAERAAVLPVLCQSMDAASRGRLLYDAMHSRCPDLFSQIWDLVVRLQPKDVRLLRAALGHPRRMVRVQAALLTLGLRTGAAQGQLP